MALKPQNSNYIPPRGSLPGPAYRKRWFRPISRYPYDRRYSQFRPRTGRVMRIPGFFQAPPEG